MVVVEEDKILEKIDEINSWIRGKAWVEELALSVKLEELRRLIISVFEPRKLPYRKNIINRLDRQTRKGIKKYGQLINENKELTDLQMLEYLAEELTDGLVYLEDIKQRYKQAMDEGEVNGKCKAGHV